MPFIKSFSIRNETNRHFPFTIPAVKYANNVIMGKAITIFVGDNGTGKSTLLESLALQLNIPLIGGFITTEERSGFEVAKELQAYLQIEYSRHTFKGFFFRAEDFSDFIHSIDRENRRKENDYSELRGVIDDKIIHQMKSSDNYALRVMQKIYGDNMNAYSHGEAYLKILQSRIKDKGIYILDEPEAALSPLKQIALIFLIQEIIKSGQAQFIISTHSPILMGIPDATIYQITEDEMTRVKYTETDHYRVTKTFLNDPMFYLRDRE